MWSSHATKRPVPYTGLHARQPHRAALIHTNGGGTDQGSLYGFWCQNANGSRGPENKHVGAHFQVMTNGHAEQYVDTDLVIYHAYSASEWALGFEVEDDRDPSRPMTPAQLATIEAILRELHVAARQLTSDQPADGVGWHEQFHAWNESGHHCPGPVREGQVRTVIIPALQQHPVVHNPYPAPLVPFDAGTRAGHELGRVKWVQWALQTLHLYTGAIDGDCGLMTRDAVVAFKKAHHLAIDPVIRQQAFNLLKAIHR